MKVYIAFSIHGTNAFITASRELPHDDVSRLGGDFTVVKSRRPGHDPKKDGVKLEWRALMTAEGKPLRSAALVLNRFNKLGQEGWTIDKSKFVDRHYRKDRVVH